MSNPTRTDFPAFPKSSPPAAEDPVAEELTTQFERARLLLDDAAKHVDAIVEGRAEQIMIGRFHFDAATQGADAVRAVADRFEEMARVLRESAHRVAARRTPEGFQSANAPPAEATHKPKLNDTVYSYHRDSEPPVSEKRRASTTPPNRRSSRPK